MSVADHVTPAEIVALLDDMPPVRGDTPESERAAWMERKRALIARIEAEQAERD